ncbi:YcaO-like family protein [Streptomyces noboritoensis]|uniref:YcaO-like family protein n=1 Tax=Streptomyces noboritoensis TaxID=67337 RepID=A0ABV6TVK2_9ACTN
MDEPMPSLAVKVLRDEDERARSLQLRMHGRLCGIITSVGGLNKPPRSPRLFVEGAELTGVHLWQGRPAPKPGSYHIGGYGFLPFESRIRVLGEALERYAGHAVVAEGRMPVTMATHAELVACGEPVIDADCLRLFTAEQLGREGFPYQPFDAQAPLGWVRVPSLLDDSEALVPAQQFLLGYVPADDEPWLVSAVTTGTAAHTAPDAALRGSLYELVQVDTAIGHWYGSSESVVVELDDRLRALRSLLDRHYSGTVAPEFHWLPSPDLPGFTVACILRSPGGAIPAISIGLGSGSGLERSMYRALLEAVGVHALAGWSLLEAEAESEEQSAEERLAGMFDLESNVGYYATIEGARAVEERFARSVRESAGNLPPDDRRPPRQLAGAMVDAFRATGKSLYWFDLTAPDIRQLGFTAVRVWSPDMLTLPFPSAPPAAHPRFAAHGGFGNPLPHPYP